MCLSTILKAASEQQARVDFFRNNAPTWPKVLTKNGPGLEISMATHVRIKGQDGMYYRVLHVESRHIPIGGHIDDIYESLICKVHMSQQLYKAGEAVSPRTGKVIDELDKDQRSEKERTKYELAPWLVDKDK